MQKTLLSLNDKLPLTCTRTGTCCHGKQVFLNPWELATIAHEKKLSAKEFSEQYCDFRGIVLRFDGAKNQRNLSACSQYIEGFGCSVHQGRPLACRLFPLGRQLQNGHSTYIFEGKTFPCLEDCGGVVNLPQLSVGDYLKGQETTLFEQAQNAYLEVMQNLADNAFALLLDSGISASGDTKTLSAWRAIGKADLTQLSMRIADDWLEALIFPTINVELTNVHAFIEAHNEQLQQLVQDKFGNVNDFESHSKASITLMELALFLAKAVGADPQSLSEYWIEIAKSYGAKEE